MLEVLIFSLMLLMMLLTSLNISTYLKPKKVLGTSVLASQQQIKDNEFWTTFLNDHPEYIPGWMEIGRFDKVKQIDPNYITP